MWTQTRFEINFRFFRIFCVKKHFSLWNSHSDAKFEVIVQIFYMIILPLLPYMSLEIAKRIFFIKIIIFPKCVSILGHAKFTIIFKTLTHYVFLKKLNNYIVSY